MLPLVLCLVVAGRLVCSYDPKGCAGGSLFNHAGLVCGRGVGLNNTLVLQVGGGASG